MLLAVVKVILTCATRLPYMPLSIRDYSPAAILMILQELEGDLRTWRFVETCF